MKKIVGLLTLMLLVVLSCKKEKGDRTSLDTGAIYVAASEQILVNTNVFDESVQALADNIPSSKQDITVEELEGLKKLYKESLLAWQKVEPYIIGDVFDEFAHLYINNWAADTASINNLLDSENVTEMAYNVLPSKAKGLPAIEFLLYQEVTNNENRIALLTFEINDLVANTSIISDSWGAYQTKFVDQSSTGRNSSLNLLLNSMYLQIETLKNKRLGNPAGLFPEIEDNLKVFEAPYSKYSVECMMENFEEFKAMYELSLSHLILENGGESITIKIRESIEKIDDSYSKLKTPISTNFQEDTVEISELFEELKTLEKILKYDVKYLLNATIYLGSDDGD